MQTVSALREPTVWWWSSTLSRVNYVNNHILQTVVKAMKTTYGVLREVNEIHRRFPEEVRPCKLDLKNEREPVR